MSEWQLSLYLVSFSSQSGGHITLAAGDLGEAGLAAAMGEAAAAGWAAEEGSAALAAES